MMTFIEKEIARSEKMLARWRGRPAKMHEFTRFAVKSLDVVMPGNEPGKNLFIACIGPRFISGPFEWSDSHIVLRPCKLDDGGEGVELLDKANGVRVVSDTFEVKENVKLKEEG